VFKRAQHLFGRTLEHPSASGAEQGVAAEKEWSRILAERLQKKGDVTPRMAGDFQDLRHWAVRPDRHAVRLRHGPVESGDGLGGGSEHLRRVRRNELRDASGMVTVVVRDQNGSQLQAASREDIEDGLGVTRVNDCSLTADRIVQEPDIVVVESSDR
jgi:hypothetical protein